MASIAAVEEPDGPDRQLHALGGLAVDHFHNIIKAGEADRRTATIDEPTNAPGTRDYIGRVRATRQILRGELGWVRLNINNMSLTVDPERQIAIGVALGDHRTAVPGLPHPRTLRPLGDMKQALVAHNQAQDPLFELPAPPDIEAITGEELRGATTWLFLTRRVLVRGKVVVYSELSRPTELDSKGHVFRWGQRIILPPVEFEGVIDYISGTDDGPVEYDIPVEDH